VEGREEGGGGRYLVLSDFPGEGEEGYDDSNT